MIITLDINCHKCENTNLYNYHSILCIITLQDVSATITSLPSTTEGHLTHLTLINLKQLMLILLAPLLHNLSLPHRMMT